MEEHPQQHHCSCRMQRLPPLHPKATPGCRKNKNTQIIGTGTLELSPPGTTSKINLLESSLPISIGPEITHLLAGECNRVETENLETSLLEVIEPKFLDSNTLQLKVIQHVEPQLTKPITSIPSLSIPLPSTQSQPVYFGPNGEEIPPGILSVKEITKES